MERAPSTLLASSTVPKSNAIQVLMRFYQLCARISFVYYQNNNLITHSSWKYRIQLDLISCEDLYVLQVGLLIKPLNDSLWLGLSESCSSRSPPSSPFSFSFCFSFSFPFCFFHVSAPLSCWELCL